MNEAYEAQAARIGARSFTRTWRFKLMVLAVFVASIAVVPGLLLLFKWRLTFTSVSQRAPQVLNPPTPYRRTS